ncbi:MAG: glycosyltransferase family 4 protein [Balneolaceae bacterium]
MENSYPNIRTVSVIGNYLPRKCGIATFTSDLVQSLTSTDHTCITIAMNDKKNGYDYPSDVQFEISQEKLTDYYTAADYLNTHEVDMVLLQHEFGIFGGPSGEYILTLLNELKMPVVTTLHTVLTNPSPKQLQVMKRLAQLSDRFVVMSKTAIQILNTLYDIPRGQIDFIPHGIPDMPFGDPNYYKDEFDLLGRKVLLTFGLLSPNKGIEHVIKSLPDVVKRFPDLSYVVLGATHPNVLKTEGEKYRRHLRQLVEDLDLTEHVIFKNEFVSFEKLCHYLSATDLYITPYNQAEQITSGTLAYAAGIGKAIISTPYWYAKEMLSDGRGKLVPFKDEKAMAEAVIEMFDDEAMRHKMRKRSYEYNRNATWTEVARQYADVFNEVRSDHNQRPRPHNASHENQFSFSDVHLNLPRININHLAKMTDSTGILQHAKFSVANRFHGYCTDDNARALIVVLKAQRLSRISGSDSAKFNNLSNRYLSFLLHAFNEETGRFYNFMSYSRLWLEELSGSEDSHGRALWSLGTAVSHSKQNSDITLASTLFMRALPITESFESPRSIAFSLLGIDAYLNTFSGDSKARRIYSVLAERLFAMFDEHSTDEWPWLEEIVTYSNGKLPHALILAGETLKRNDMQQMGLKSLRWLLEIQKEDEHFVPIGNHGWYKRNSVKARFDQQPLEANNLLEAAIAAYELDGDEYWLDHARSCFSWFLGKNDLNLSLYNPKTGGCRDGLHIDSVNLNEGAESTLAWLLSLTAMYQLLESDTLPSKKMDRVKLQNSKIV